MNLTLVIFDALCSTKVFKINDITADKDDFGDQGDKGPGEGEEAEDYCCSNMTFTGKPSTPEVLEKYKINEQEYQEICSKLEDELSWGSCGWCS